MIATANATLLSDDEAEEWIRALQLMLAATAASMAIVDEEDLRNLNEENTEIVTTLQAGISLMMEALDA